MDYEALNCVQEEKDIPWASEEVRSVNGSFQNFVICAMEKYKEQVMGT